MPGLNLENSPPMLDETTLQRAINLNVTNALDEDIGPGDITAHLIPDNARVSARVISRDNAVICGTAWVNEVFRRLDPSLEVSWHIADGDRVSCDQTLLVIEGRARPILTGERCALNFLQTLSGTATTCHQYAQRIAGTGVKLLDTRKTLPGLRIAQKYAVSCGGCHNHRIGLYDAFLIKENHIQACGSIATSIQTARSIAPGKPVEVEVENLDELDQALTAGADIIMLDNFSLENLRAAVDITAGRAKLEASGGITDSTLRPIAQTGVDYISIGALTKNCQAIDLSMRFGS